MKFSIIVPIYNVEKYLNYCIESILTQTYEDFELILVDDGSEDNSSRICDQYVEVDKRVKCIHKENGGIISARRAGTDIAQGEYIVCVDSDDWINKKYLERFAVAIEKNNADIVCCGYMSGNEKNLIPNILKYRFGVYKKKDIEKEIFPKLIESKEGEYFPPMLWGKAIKSSIYKTRQINCDEKLRNIVGEDHALTKACIYIAETIVILEECLYNYRLNFQSITKGRKAYAMAGPEIIGKHFEMYIDMEKYDFQDQVYRNVTHNVFNVVMSQFNRKEDYKTIKQELQELLQNKYIQNAIRKCKYSGNIKGMIAKELLKYKLYWVIRILNKIRR